jgi:gliding motility-associated-like protein
LVILSTLKKIFLFAFFVFAVIIIRNEKALAQKSPAIAYNPAKQIYNTGSAITPLSPTNTGGTVYPANYSTPSNFVSYNTPYSIAIDGTNNVYTTNNITGYLTKYNSAGKVLFTVNTGSPMASGVAVDGLGNIYVSQFTASSVLKYNAAGTLLATITGFHDPYGIAFDASNNAYVADYFTGDIFGIKAGATGTTVASVYLTGFNKPYGIIIDKTGNMYVSEQSIGVIIKVAAGTLTKTTFASGFNGPRHLNKDLFGNIYVADYGHNAIKRISPAGVVTTIVSAGLNSPRQAAFDSSGNLFVANYGTNTLLKALATDYSINAPLPAGLSFNTSTGQISGNPTVVIAAKTFTISAYNTGGSSSTPLTITVQSPPVPNITNAIAYAIGTTNNNKSDTGNDTDSVAKSPIINDANADKIIVHPAVSPNGDGINDFLRIEGLENYPENRVTLINRSGGTIYSVKGYNNSNIVFDGHSNINGRLELPGTYFYIVEYTINGQTRRKTGYFVLKYR